MIMDKFEFGGKKGLHLTCLNVRSLYSRGKFDMLKQQIIDSKTHVFCAGETWLKEEFPSGLIDIPGYSLYRRDRSWSEDGKNTKKGGGLAMYIDSNLEHSGPPVENVDISTKDIELQCMTISLPLTRKIVVLNVYRPPQGGAKTFGKLVCESILKVKSKDNTEVYVMGDMNIDVKGNGSTASKDLITRLKSLGFLQLIKHHTRVTALTQSTIDLVFTNSDLVEESGIININVSDHLATFVTRKKHKVSKTKISFEGRSYKNYSVEDFQEDLVRKDWTDFYSCTDPNKCWEVMYRDILSTLDNYCPTKSFYVKEISQLWINRDALELIRDKDSALARAKRTNRAEDWEFAKRLRNRVGTTIQNMRRDFIEEEQRANYNNPQKFWRNLKTVVPGKKEQPKMISLKENGRQIPLNETADYLNTFFAEIGRDLLGINRADWFYEGPNSENYIEDCSTTFLQVQNIVKDINTNKSSGLDGVSSRVLKDAFLVLIPQVVYMFNLSLTTGIFPRDWKVATVVPLYKGGDRTSVGNYRPISLLPIPGKLLEKLCTACYQTIWKRTICLLKANLAFVKVSQLSALLFQ